MQLMILLEKKRINGVDEVFHFAGIGGIGMSGMAEIMHNLGYRAQGSDLAENNNTTRLRALGIKIFLKQDGSALKDASYLVISSAIKADNLELIAAKKIGIPVISRAEMLAELMRLKCSIAISGSHGKTTTTSMVAALFEEAGLAPTVINGGIINNRQTNAYLGKSDYLIAEADESDATFIKIPATVGVITNIDPEHMDFYADFDELYASFKSFINNLPFYGFAVACIDHPTVKKLVDETLKRRVITYAIDNKQANIVGRNIRLEVDHSVFDVSVNIAGLYEELEIKEILLPTAGRHNVMNSLAAIATGLQMHIAPEQIKSGFKNFAGVKRRFCRVGHFNGATIIDDYAHHPVEINATLQTARIVAKPNNGRIFAIFQPHRYSRLNLLFDDFATCFGAVEKIYITDVFAAGEQPINGADSDNLIKKINACSDKSLATHAADEQTLAKQLFAQLKPNDIVVFMGAGSITKWAANAEGELKVAKAEMAKI